ncbi:cornifelin homolog B-like [Synchiropus picturatus]
MAPQALRNWHTDLCDCCEDIGTCCYGFWCCPCLACTVSSKFESNACFPVCDMLCPIMSAVGIPLIVPPAGLSIRAAMRHKYGIRGDLCNDTLLACFCVICNWCQMHRELKNIEKNRPVVVNVMTNTVVQQQPHMMIPVQTVPAVSPQNMVVMTQ